MEDADTPARPRGRRKVALALLIVLLLALVLLWMQRKPIATDFIDGELTRRGVPARYTVSQIGPFTQRLENVSIGDPARPDLTARWAEVDIGYRFGWPVVRAMRAEGVRLRGRLVDGQVKLGAVDKLLPAPTGEPLALPDLDVVLADARMRLETPAGPLGMALDGRGNLADGFRGQLAIIGHDLASSGCTLAAPSAVMKIVIRDKRPTLDGPARATSLACPASGVVAEAPRFEIKATLGPALDSWKGEARLVLASLAQRANRVEQTSGVISFDGNAKATSGVLQFAAANAHAPQGTMQRASFAGRYAVGDAAPRLDGQAQLAAVTLAPALIRPTANALRGAQGTPVGPLGVALAQALENAGRRFDARASIALDGGNIAITRLDATSASGARVALSGGSGVSYAPDARASRFDGDLLVSGGGFPTISARLRQAAGAPLAGEVNVAPYAAGGARLALGTIRFTASGGGATRFDTVVTLDGPVADGRVRGLTLPVSGRFDGRGGFAINPDCAPLDFASLSVAGLDIGRSRLPLCPVGGALLARSGGGAISGGAAIARPRLAGRLGAQPATIVAESLRVDIGTPGFSARSLGVRLGKGADVTRLDIANLAGKTDPAGLGGRFEGAAGKIASVPLLLSDGRGNWRLANSRLRLDAHLQVADEAAEPRFEPLVSDDVRLALVNGVITATGQLRAPANGVAVTNVSLTHDLATATGGAALDVPGITFGPSFQPETLTKLTLGVVANVAGTISGQGRIAWTADGVTSSGDFRTAGTSLAAAFGPVTGLSGEIHFSDLLALATPPGQEVRLAEVNPGIAVNDGVVRYQLLPGQLVRIESGRWPFSGGELVLDATTLDLGRPVARHLTFRVDGLDAAKFIQRFEFENVAATGSFDGVLPMVFDAEGGRIEDGRLTVRQGGGTLAYVGEVSNADLGTFGKLAFDALKSIRYDNLTIELDGAIDGEIVSRIVFTGVNDKPLDGKESAGMFRELIGLPFKFNITIKAPFRGLLTTASNFIDPTGLLREQRLRADEAPVQPQESEDMR